MGSHFQNVPAHLSHSNHDELGHILLGVGCHASPSSQQSRRAEPEPLRLRHHVLSDVSAMPFSLILEGGWQLMLAGLITQL